MGSKIGYSQSVFPMLTKLTLDQAGRLMIPKALRQQLHLGPGDTLQLESEGDRITLRPVRPEALLKKEQGVWVFQGEPVNASIPDLIDQQREKRLRELTG
jgi:AbrB family looped-hinge helix DNA binding protein